MGMGKGKGKGVGGGIIPIRFSSRPSMPCSRRMLIKKKKNQNQNSKLPHPAQHSRQFSTPR